MKSSLCLCLGTNLCKSPKSPPVIFHNRPNVPVNVPAAEQNCNYILSSTRANISSTVNCISPIVNCILSPTRENMSCCLLYFFNYQLYFVFNKGKFLSNFQLYFSAYLLYFANNLGKYFSKCQPGVYHLSQLKSSEIRNMFLRYCWVE